MTVKMFKRILRYFGSKRTSLVRHKIACHGQCPLRNQKNWTWSRKFTQIPSIWWKYRENRSSRYWDSFAHSKKIGKLENAWQSLAYSPLRAIVSTPSLLSFISRVQLLLCRTSISDRVSICSFARWQHGYFTLIPARGWHCGAERAIR